MITFQVHAGVVRVERWRVEGGATQEGFWQHGLGNLFFSPSFYPFLQVASQTSQHTSIQHTPKTRDIAASTHTLLASAISLL